MQRFIEQQNIALYQRLLLEETSEAIVRSLLLQSQRKLAAIEADVQGAFRSDWTAKRHRYPVLPNKCVSVFQREFEQASTLLLIDTRPGLHIVDANKLYTAAAMIDIAEVAGERIFDIFPDNPSDPIADGVARLYSSVATVAESGRPHAMAIQRYDVRDAAGEFVERTGSR
ncbi:diguanylate cyclase [Bradyrhizobium sp. 2TAF36]|uniref:diguanylate cyclase n=1 Tax=unclassified Bradyrhizobium TaxID=2631580 RepID=UPI001FCE819E|nr:diguanylate cyclase [Bradyrhizobium sp. MOS001]